MKRFWDNAGIAPHAEGWHVTLDGKPVRVPSGSPLSLPVRALAEAVAAEWQDAGGAKGGEMSYADLPMTRITGTGQERIAPNPEPVVLESGSPLSLPVRALAEAVAAEWRDAGGAKGGEMSYADLPMTRITGTGQERIAPNPEPVVLEIARYGESDLLCYRADKPAELVEREQAHWQPLLDWAGQELGAPLRVTQGVVHVPQPPQALAALAAAVASYGPFALAALGVVVPALGSLVLGLALARGRLGAADAHWLATLDEVYQEEYWGVDDEALARRRLVADDIAVAARVLELLRA